MQFFGERSGKKVGKKQCRREMKTRVEWIKRVSPAGKGAIRKNTVQEVCRMAYSIRVNEVRRALQPMLGTQLVTQTALCDHAADTLRRHQPGKESPQQLQRELKECLFADLYELLGHQMLLKMDNGAVRRILLKDVDFMVDECIGVLLDVMQGPDMTLEGLRSYAMTEGSLSAMRVLLERYGDELPDMEKEMLRRIIRENHPLNGWRGM